MPAFPCRFCAAPLAEVVVDLGSSPLANSLLDADKLQQMEPTFPLCVYLCTKCLLVQLPAVESPEAIFSDYVYFSSFSDSWLAHARSYVEAMIERFGISSAQQVIEIASNDGYLLRFFHQRGVPVLGIEPAANVAAAAEAEGIPTLVKFFGSATARELLAQGKQADLLIGNNVLAHVPELNDFIVGLKTLLAPCGTLTMEFPHLLRLVEGNQFDTIYHEHFSYFSLLAVRRIFAAHGLEIFDVEELSTHGGSLRIYARHQDATSHPVGPRVDELEEREKSAGMTELAWYRSFGERVRETKRKLLEFLIGEKRAGRQIIGYGAPAKGNTLLNYCGVRTDFIDYTVDKSPHKQDKWLPGVRIPIHGPERIRETRPDWVLILPWNLREEIMAQVADLRSWGGKFVVAIPEVQVFE